MFNKKILLVYIVILLFLLGGCGAIWLSVKNDPSSDIYEELDLTAANANAAHYYMDVHIGEGWENADKESKALYGTQYDLMLYNNTESSIYDWEIQIQVPKHSYIDSAWNGVYTIDKDNMLTVTCVSYNEEIAAKESIKLGMIMYTPGPWSKIESFAISAKKVNTLYDKPLFWALIVIAFTVLVIAITNMINSIKYQRMQVKYGIYREVTDQALNTFARIIDAKDEYTSGHSYRVGIYSRALAKRMGLDAEEQERIYHIALLHDIGKIGVPDSILTGKTQLTEEEWNLIKAHVSVGGNILMEFSSIPGIDDGARYHHERYDGKGYSSGLKGEEIPLCARIICVADAFDAMSSARSYRSKLPHDKILSELKNGTGTQFDPDIVKHMIDMLQDGSAPINSMVNVPQSMDLQAVAETATAQPAQETKPTEEATETE